MSHALLYGQGSLPVSHARFTEIAVDPKVLDKSDRLLYRCTGATAPVQIYSTDVATALIFAETTMSQRIPVPPRSPDSKVGQVCDQLCAMAFRHGPGYRLPTSRELCILLGTSQVTLNDALNALESQRILLRKSRSGIFVSPQLHHRHILVLLDSRFFAGPGLSPFWGHLWGRFAAAAQERAAGGDVDFSFTLIPSRPDAPLPESVMREVESGRAHAALGVGLEVEAAEWLAHRVPVVQFAGPGTYFIRLDSFAVIREGVPLLAKRGCQRIALLYPWDTHRPDREPYPEWSAMQKQFRELLRASGVAAENAIISGDLTLAQAGGGHQEQGYALANKLFASPKDAPDGLLIQDDMLALGVLAALRQRGITLGEDVSMVTHANAGSPVLFGYESEIDRMEVNPQDIVDAMFALLNDLLAGKTPAEAVVTVPSRLCARERRE